MKERHIITRERRQEERLRRVSGPQWSPQRGALWVKEGGGVYINTALNSHPKH